jgi:hypothetical protein
MAGGEAYALGMAWPAAVTEWGSTAEERARPYPCDGFVENPEAEIFRAVDVEAPQAVTFRWLCQRVDEERSRIVVKLSWKAARRGLLGLPERILLPPGDLVMMRRQLLNLKQLAERSPR